MAKAELGTKRVCPSCGARFYDLRRNPAACPSCGHSFNPDDLVRSRRARSAPAEEPKPVEEKAKAVAAIKPAGDDADVPEEVAADEEADDELLEDASDIGEDGDDIGEVMENVDEPAEER
ncbi:MAG: TIGR02300 family protein [Alphaproteobacteria bacterium]